MKNRNSKILIVDDEVVWCNTMKIGLGYCGIENIEICNEPQNALELIRVNKYQLILLDLCMPKLSGEELLKMLKLECPDIPVVVVTAEEDIQVAVKCMKLGANNYITKPVEPHELLARIEQTLNVHDLENQLRRLHTSLTQKDIEHPEYFKEIITVNNDLKKIFRYIEVVAESKSPVLLQGESGTGKELFARAIHKASKLSGEFVGVNIAAMDDSMLHSTLFGHQKGAFTGAQNVRGGLVSKADGGTLFLDEIGDMAAEGQVKLLRLLQEKEYYPLGSDTPREANIRVIVATHRDLSDEKIFRKDLYYRLNAHAIMLPPLREHLDDIPILVEHFVRTVAADYDLKSPAIPQELFLLLSNYSYPGNIRELENMVRDAVLRSSRNRLSLTPFKEHIDKNRCNFVEKINISTNDLTEWQNLPTLKQIQEMLIDESLRRCENNISLAAQMLGITRQALGQRLKKKSSTD